MMFLEPITFKDTPTEQNGTAGEEATTLRCEASGSPTPVIKWSGPHPRLESPKFEQVGDGLAIRNPTPKDAGIYICMAIQNGVDSFDTARIQFNVLRKYLFLQYSVGVGHHSLHDAGNLYIRVKIVSFLEYKII